MTPSDTQRNWIDKAWFKIAFPEGCSSPPPNPSNIRWEFFNILWFLCRNEELKALEALNSFRGSYSLPDRLALPSEKPRLVLSPHSSPIISYKLRDVHATTKDTIEGAGRMEEVTDATQPFPNSGPNPDHDKSFVGESLSTLTDFSKDFVESTTGMGSANPIQLRDMIGE